MAFLGFSFDRIFVRAFPDPANCLIRTRLFSAIAEFSAALMGQELAAFHAAVIISILMDDEAILTPRLPGTLSAVWARLPDQGGSHSIN